MAKQGDEQRRPNSQDPEPGDSGANLIGEHAAEAVNKPADKPRTSRRNAPPSGARARPATGKLLSGAKPEEKGRRAQKTQIGRTAPVTMLQPSDEPPLDEPPVAKPVAEPPAPKAAKPTRIAKKSAVPTMLSPAQEDAGEPPAARPPVMPNLSLDDADDASPAPASDELVDAEVIDVHEPEIIEAEPISDIGIDEEILDADVLEDGVDAGEVAEAIPDNDEEIAEPLFADEDGEDPALNLADVPLRGSPPSDVALPDLVEESGAGAHVETFGVLDSGESGVLSELQRQSHKDDFLFSDTPPPGREAAQADIEDREADLFQGEQNLQLADELAAAGFADPNASPPEDAEELGEEDVFADEDVPHAGPISAPSNLQQADFAAEIGDEEIGAADEGAEAIEVEAEQESAPPLPTAPAWDLFAEAGAEDEAAHSLDDDDDIEPLAAAPAAELEDELTEADEDIDADVAALLEGEEHVEEVLADDDEILEADGDLDVVAHEDEEVLADHDEIEDEDLDVVSDSSLNLVDEEPAQDALVDEEEVVEATSGLDIVGDADVEAAEELLTDDDDEVVDDVLADDEVAAASDLDVVGEEEAVEDVLADDEEIVEAVSDLDVVGESGLDLVEEEAVEDVLADDEEVVEAASDLDVVGDSGLDLVEEEAVEDVLADDEEVVEAASDLDVVGESGLDLVEDEAVEDVLADDEEVVEAASNLDLIEDEEAIEDVLADEDAVEAVGDSSLSLADDEAEEAVEAAAEDELANVGDVLFDEDAEAADEVVDEEAEEVAAADDYLVDEFAAEDEAVEEEALADDYLVDDVEEPIEEELAADDDLLTADADEDVALAADDLVEEDVDELLADDDAEEVVAEEEPVDLDMGSEEFDDVASGIDSIAEELESGLALNRTVEDLDDIDFASEEEESSSVDLGSLPSKKKGRMKDSNIFADADEEEALEAADDEMADDLLADEGVEEAVDDEAAFEDVEEEAAEELALDDEDAVIDEDAAADLLADEEPAFDEGDLVEEPAYEAEEEAVEEAFDEEPVAAAPRGKRRRPRGDEDEDRGRRGKPPRKPKYMRRWAGGFVLANLVIVAAAAGLWYFNPDQLDQWMTLVPPSPNAKSGIFSAERGAVRLTPVQEAREHISNGKFTDAIALLKDANTPDAQAVRGEARWLNYLNVTTENKLPLNPSDEQVKMALSDLQARPLLKKQIDETLNLATLREQINNLAGSEKIALGMLDTLIKANVLPPQADVRDLPAGLNKALSDKQLVDQTVDQFRKLLADAKIIDMNDQLSTLRFQVVVNDFKGMRQLLDGVQQKLATANIKDVADRGVDVLLAAKKDVEDKLNAVNKQIADAGAKDVKELTDTRDKLAKDRDELATLVNGAFQELAAGKFVPDKADPRKSLVDGIKSARSKAESPIVIPLSQLVTALGNVGMGAGEWITRGFDATAAAAELSFYRGREPFVQGPEAKLETWEKLLSDRDFTSPQELASATRDAEYVRSADSRASLETRAHALFILGLVQRNQEKFDEAKAKLKGAIDEAALAKSTAPWTKSVALAYAELTDPGSYHLPRIVRAENARDYKLALQEVEAGLRVMPNSPPLLARRSLIRLELATAQGEVPQDVQEQIRQDALAAEKDMSVAGEANYALGRLEETLDNFDEAEKRYRAALAVHAALEATAQKRPAAEASRYRVALGRLLLRDPERRPRFPANDDPKKLGQNAAVLPSVLVLALTGVQFDLEDDNPLAAKRINESIRVANELILSDDLKIKGEGYMMLGQAHALLGRRTEGLKEYIKGLQLVFPGRETKELMVMIDTHPAFQQPDTLVKPNPYLAENHFGMGLRDFWSTDYAKAEQQFLSAIGYFGQDARYYYFLGLARMQQKTPAKREAAYYALERGATLEAENRPPTSEINASLERIQGETRQFLNGFRQKGAAALP